MLRKLRHPCIVELIEIIHPKNIDNFDTIYVVMELVSTDLKKILNSHIKFNHLHITTILFNLLSAVKYLHDSKVIHRDLKPANILVNEDCTVKICDFGLARSISGIENKELLS